MQGAPGVRPGDPRVRGSTRWRGIEASPLPCRRWASTSPRSRSSTATALRYGPSSRPAWTRPACPSACTVAPIEDDPPTTVVSALVRACEARDLDAVCALVTDDIEYDNVPIGKVFGPEGVRTVLSGGVDGGGHAGRVGRAPPGRRPAARRDERAHRPVPRRRPVDRDPDRRRCSRCATAGSCLWRDYFDLETYRLQRQASV